MKINNKLNIYCSDLRCVNFKIHFRKINYQYYPHNFYHFYVKGGGGIPKIKEYDGGGRGGGEKCDLRITYDLIAATICGRNKIAAWRSGSANFVRVK